MAEQEKVQLTEEDMFLIFLYGYAQELAQEPVKGYLTLIFELLKKAQYHLVSKKEINEMNLANDMSLKNDNVINVISGIQQRIIGKLTKLGENAVVAMIQTIHHQINEYIKVQQDQVLNLDLFAPTSLVYKLLEQMIKSKHFQFTEKIFQLFDGLLNSTFTIFEIYKKNSQVFIINIQSSSKYEDDKQIRRMSGLFTDLLELLITFCCQYLKALSKLGHNQSYLKQAIHLYTSLYQDIGQNENENVIEYFTLRERLKILNELNSIFCQINEIVCRTYYWNMIKEGLIDQDNYCRKVSMSVLKMNLQVMGGEALYQGFLTKQQFELLWTTLFDLYDTLESFGSHLTKAVWERTEVLYDYIRQYQSNPSSQKFHPLLDFKGWLLVVYGRVQSHPNLKLRRYVQKSTIKRKYMTTNMGDYLFEEFLKALNKGLLFKDSNIYTQFSMYNDLVNQFYERYFTQESLDVAADMNHFFKGFIKHVTHPQLILCTLRNLSRDYTQKGRVDFIGNEELQMMQEIMDRYFAEQMFSNRYLCYKYVMRILSLYLKQDSADLNLSLLLKIIGRIPIEVFSNQTVYEDTEGHQIAMRFVDKFGIPNLISIIQSYLSDIFTIKAMVSQMPKLGNETDIIINGLGRIILIIGLKTKDYIWFRQLIQPCLEGFSQILNSSYLSPEVLESKVRFISGLYSVIYRYSEDSFKNALRQDFLPHIHLVMDRFENNMLHLVAKYEIIQHQPSENQKIQSLFSELSSYLKYLQLSIQMNHIHLNSSNSPVEKTIKLVLTQAIKLSQLAEYAQGWGPFLEQYVVYKTLRQIMKCYAQGIKECLRKGVSYFMIPEDIFTFGKALLNAIIQFKAVPRPKESEDQISSDQKKFLIDHDITVTYMAQDVLLNQWKILSELIQIFQFEAQLKQELFQLYPVIAEKAAEFLQRSTVQYHNSLFRILKVTYIPIMIANIQNQGKQEDAIFHFQELCTQMWSIIKDLQNDVKPTIILEFLEFSFHPDVMELYIRVVTPETQVQIAEFHQKLAKEIFEFGNKYWLIMRSAFNHFMTIFAKRPHLMKGFEGFIVNFAICREVRNLDSQILLYKLKHIIPQIIEKDYENLNMEEITYQGAYIRSMTMIMLEGLIKQTKEHILSGQPLTQQIMETTDALETIILQLLDLNFEQRYLRADIPYSDKHRMKVRVWQTLVVVLDLLDPMLYTSYFRQMRMEHSGRDLVHIFNDKLWKVITLNHLPTVRQYIEIVAIKFSVKFPSLSIEDPMFIKTLLDPNIKSQMASSFLMIAGFVMSKSLNVANQIQLRQRLMEHMSGFLTSNSAHVRCIAQYFMHSMNKDLEIKACIPPALNNILEYLNKNKDCQKVIARYDIDIKKMDEVVNTLKGVEITLSTQIDQYGEFLSVPFVEMLKILTSEVIHDIRVNQDEQPTKREQIWKDELQRRKDEGEFNMALTEESTSNYQRKILPWEQVEYDYELLKRVHDNRKRNDIIMCAALIDKVPNLGGLARTSEIMNASCLVINNKAVTELDEFKGVAVTSEKWLPIIEVQEKDLYQYLELQKSNGYKILGLEQTANSKMLNDYKFPSKCVMLLGKEKEGIPQQYLGILDECIEIPQFGIIRSLNVHVSGALCLWEYTKQHIPKKQ